MPILTYEPSVKLKPRVATVAGGLVEEDVHPADLRGGHRLGVAVLVAVVGGVAREDGPLEGGDRLGHVVDGDLARAERLLEAVDVAGDAAEDLDGRLVREVGGLLGGHLERVGDRALGLLLQRGGAAVPELVGAVGAVDHRRGAAAPLLLADAEGDLRAVGERLVGRVAARARDGLVGGEAVVEVEQSPQLDLGGRVRVVLGPVDRREAERRGRGVSALGAGTGAGAAAGSSRAAAAIRAEARVAVRVVTAIDGAPDAGWADGRAGPSPNLRRGPRGVGRWEEAGAGSLHFLARNPCTYRAFCPSTSVSVPLTVTTCAISSTAALRKSVRPSRRGSCSSSMSM